MSRIHAFVILGLPLVLAPIAETSHLGQSLGASRLMDALVTESGTRRFAAAFVASDLARLLAHDEPITLFVPVDEASHALATISAPWADGASSSSELFTALLSRHIVMGSWTIDRLEGVSSLDAHDGHSLLVQAEVAVEGRPLMVDGSTIVRSVVCSNGVLHVIQRSLTSVEETLWSGVHRIVGGGPDGGYNSREAGIHVRLRRIGNRLFGIATEDGVDADLEDLQQDSAPHFLGRIDGNIVEWEHTISGENYAATGKSYRATTRFTGVMEESTIDGWSDQTWSIGGERSDRYLSRVHLKRQ